MLSIDQLRKLNPQFEKMDDRALEELRSAMYQLGQLCFDVWWTEKSGSKNPTGVFPPAGPSDTLTLWSKEQKQG